VWLIAARCPASRTFHKVALKEGLIPERTLTRRRHQTSTLSEVFDLLLLPFIWSLQYLQRPITEAEIRAFYRSPE